MKKIVGWLPFLGIITGFVLIVYLALHLYSSKKWRMVELDGYQLVLIKSGDTLRVESPYHIAQAIHNLNQLKSVEFLVDSYYDRTGRDSFVVDWKSMHIEPKLDFGLSRGFGSLSRDTTRLY